MPRRTVRAAARGQHKDDSVWVAHCITVIVLVFGNHDRLAHMDTPVVERLLGGRRACCLRSCR